MTAPAAPPLRPTRLGVEALFPELTGLARETTLLCPRIGEPGVRDSSVGGPLLWPADEPWPMCGAEGHYEPLRRPTEVVGPEPVAMVPVVQLYARDVPELPFPAGTDVLQVVWCPLLHDDGIDAVSPRLYWRDERAVGAGTLRSDRPEPYTADEDFVPRPCTVTPTRAVEYPNGDLPEGLGEALTDRFDEVERRFGVSYFDAATTIQSKVGGYPGWTQAPDWPTCRCGRRMAHLLSVTATETGPWHGDDDADAGHGMDMGDLGGVYLFVCTTCPDRPFAHRYDC
ncbi:hypothetical protein [Streptomyces sp. NPDC127098]|uniref:hypothetical protein n=1 Tax=Streptomyces sp. NPDC127098 TaxID=3347137 RepID=UPI00365451E5